MNIQAYGISIFKDRHIGKCTFHVQYHPLLIYGLMFLHLLVVLLLIIMDGNKISLTTKTKISGVQINQAMYVYIN